MHFAMGFAMDCVTGFAEEITVSNTMGLHLRAACLDALESPMIGNIHCNLMGSQ